MSLIKRETCVRAFVCVAIVCSAFAYAARAQRTERKDKVKIKGEIVAFENRVSGEVSFALDLVTLIVRSSDAKRGLIFTKHRIGYNCQIGS